MRYKQHKQYRCQNYDYSQNRFYFITICAKNRELLFGEIIEGKMNLSDIGKIAEKFWLEITAHFPFVKLDEFIIMPNHIHGVIWIDKNDNKSGVGTQDFVFLREKWGKNKFGPQSKNLASIIRGFKIGVTKYANNNNINFAWQSRFYDRIIRNEEELNRIRQYIIDNPAKWELDKNNLENLLM